MARFIIKRIFISVLTVWALATLTFFLMRLLPGDPFIGPKAVPENIRQAMYEKYGLDKPLIVQYGKFISNTAHGDLGDSLQYKNRPVSGIIKQAFPYSFDLGMRALLIAVSVGLLLGIVAALNHGKIWDSTTIFIAVLGVSVPGFIMGSILQYGIALELTQWIQKTFHTTYKLLPVTGWESFKHTILPSIALSFGSMASIARYMRTSMLDVMQSDYIKTAKAKGLTRIAIVWKHAIRNAIMPVVTILGPITAALLTGAFVIENIFGIPGMGRFFVQGIQNNDYPMIAGTTIFYGAFLVTANLIVDIAYGLIDPRIRLAK